MPKPLRITPGDPVADSLLAPIPLHVPQELADVTPTGPGKAEIKIRDFLYIDGRFYPVKSIKELKK